jgi:hypothetical protein
MCAYALPERWEASGLRQRRREALREAAKDPSLRYEAEWALNRIAGVESREPVVSPILPAPSVASQP